MDKKQTLIAISQGKHGTATDTLAYWSSLTGWDTVTDLDLACEFITESGMMEKFSLFLREKSQSDRQRYGSPEDECDECGVQMPPTAELVNTHHDKSCSLHGEV